jgi:trans-aconitate 2-methyltransferase
MKGENWDPRQYEKFRAERMAPFDDLMRLVEPAPAMRVVDLGCGTGEITARLAELLPDATVEGIDYSTAMLDAAAPRATDRLAFTLGRIEEFREGGQHNLVFSHAALQWVPDHERFFPRLLEAMKPGAQIAVQMPKNESHPSHRVADEVAGTEPLRTALGGFVRRTAALALERYAELLHAHGFGPVVCLEKIYGHELARSADVVEWVKGTMLGAYLARLEGDDRERFLEAYRERLLAEIGPREPYYYPFRRMLLWGRKSRA